MLLPTLLLAAALQAPTAVVLDAEADHHFAIDSYTSAKYLGLAGDGRYVVVDVQHMFTRAMDEGHWRVDGSTLLLESDYSFRSLRAGDFHVNLQGRCAGELLPALRTALQALHDRGTTVPVRELRALRLSRAGDPQAPGASGGCVAEPGYFNPEEFAEQLQDGAGADDDLDFLDAGSFAAERLSELLRAIDAWLADAANQHVFEYRSWAYRGRTFLVPMRPGMQANQPGVAEVQERMDANDDFFASFIYYAIPADAYARGVGCTYAFKVHQEMNPPCNSP